MLEVGYRLSPWMVFAVGTEQGPSLWHWHTPFVVVGYVVDRVMLSVGTIVGVALLPDLPSMFSGIVGWRFLFLLNVKGRFFLGGRLRRSAAKATSCTQRPSQAARASCAQASGRRGNEHAWGGVQCASDGAYLAALSLGGRRPSLGK